MKEDNVLQVYYEEKRVGILALTADHKAAFQYDEKWLENGFRSIGNRWKVRNGSADLLS